MQKLTLTKEQACRFLLTYQGLYPPYALEGKPGILAYIHRVGCIQFDPLDIVGHNQELVLQSRIANFKPLMLQELLYKDRLLLDGLDKNMSIYDASDWPYFSRNRESARRYYGHSSRPALAILPQVREAITERGPLSSIDLDFDETVDWPWAPTRLSRAALESMYLWGELIIHHKVHTRKVYDFTARHIPDKILSAPDPNKSEAEYHDWYIARRIGSIGLLWNKSGDAWLGISGIKSKERQDAIKRLLEKKRLIEVEVEGMETMFYMRSEDKPILDKAMLSDCQSLQAAILAPLDNLLWERRLVKELFGFEYRWEVYKPVPERQYGYYVLPILYGDRFVARFEPAKDKKNKTLLIKNWWWEPGVKQTKALHNELNNCFQKFLCYLGVEKLRIENQIATQKKLEMLKCL